MSLIRISLVVLLYILEVCKGSGNSGFPFSRGNWYKRGVVWERKWELLHYVGMEGNGNR